VSDKETRFTSVRVEVRSAADDDRRTIGGYAAKFDTLSQNLGGFRERIAPGAFNRAASRGWPGFDGTGVMARYNHDDNLLLATTGGGSLRLRVDETGLVYEADLLDDETSLRVYKLVGRGDVRKSSFAFTTDDDDWTTDDSGFPLRTLVQVNLGDVAPVNGPAYLDTDTGLRSLARKFDADVAEVRSLAAANELRRFFKVTSDGGTPTQTEAKRSAQAALAKVMSLPR
jgi:HK97 family phage prohead protease